MISTVCLLRAWLARIRDDRGASLVEYGLLLALIAVVCFAAVTFFGENVSTQFSTSADDIKHAGN